MRRKMISGYSAEVVSRYFNLKKKIFSLSSKLIPQYQWENQKPTNTVVGYRAWFVQEGTEPFIVKFVKKVDLPKFMSAVELTDLEGIEIGNSVYFRATDLKEVEK